MDKRILKGCEENVPEVPFASLGKLMYDNLKTHPENKIALVNVNNGGTYSYGEIIKYSVNLAKNLKILNITKDDIIAISSESNHQFFLPVLAALYIGTPIHLINPTYTSYELQHILKKTNPKLIFCTKKSINNIQLLRNELNFIEFIVLIDDDDDNAIDSTDGFLNFKNLLKDVDTEFKIEENFNIAEKVGIIANSSGTTGLPKAAMLTHESLRLDLLCVKMPTFCKLTSEYKTILILPLFHIYGWSVLRTFLYCGCTVFLSDHFDPHQFLSIIEKEKIQVLFVVPSLLNFLAKSPLLDNYDLSSLDDIINAAGPSSEEILEMVCKRFNLNHIRQMYSTTELASVFSFTPSNEYKKGSSGKLIPFRQLKVINPETGDILGENEIGLFCIKGGILKGYIGNEEETYKSIDEDGFLNTGDVGYYDKDGFIYIIDRIKDLIKYKSYQVAPMEIEDILLKHPAVKEAAVVGKPDPRFGELPVAFITRNDGYDVTEKELIDFVAQYVCEQKHLHGGVRFVKEIPKNSVGKILKRNLRDLLL